MTRAQYVANASAMIYAMQFKQLPGDQAFSISRAIEQAEALASAHEAKYGPFEYGPVVDELIRLWQDMRHANETKTGGGLEE